MSDELMIYLHLKLQILDVNFVKVRDLISTLI